MYYNLFTKANCETVFFKTLKIIMFFILFTTQNINRNYNKVYIDYGRATPHIMQFRAIANRLASPTHFRESSPSICPTRRPSVARLLRNQSAQN